MSLFTWKLPANSPQAYYINLKFTNLCCRKIDFDASITKYRMTFFEFMEVVQDLRAHGSPHITYAKFTKVVHLVLTLLFIGLLLWIPINHQQFSLSFSSTYLQVIVLYGAITLLLILIQILQEMRAAKKMREHLTTVNPVLFNIKQLHWEVDTYARYIIVRLNYVTLADNSQSTILGLKPTALDMSNRSSLNLSSFSLDYSSQSVRQSIITPYKYKF